MLCLNFAHPLSSRSATVTPFISFADKIEFPLKGDSIVACCKRAVHGVGLAVPDLPVRDELHNGAMPPPGLVIKISITIRLERNGTKRAGDEINANIGKVELLARSIR